MTERVDAIVIGAGVIGLACARALALAGREVLILEQHGDIGTETSSRNSEVIHAGIYYPQGSLKARACVAGRQQLYDYCRDRGVRHSQCGKLIVATSADQQDRLVAIRARAAANGVNNLELLTRAAARALEPELDCTAALLSPSTGIIDSHELMLALLGDAENRGAVLALNAPVLGGRRAADGIELTVGGAAPLELRASVVVNAAGLHAPALAASLAGMPAESVPRAYYARGNYFSLAGRAPFARLIYPVPEPGGLGVHLTLDLAGQARFGPDVEWIDSIGYAVDPARGEVFYDAIRRYWPALPDRSLEPAYAGVRPKIVGPGAADADFVVQGPRLHGVAGLVNLFGIESPGLTSCLALAAEVLASLGVAKAVPAD
jgi:L-2-hydroxyglutarate oxidase LhgO